VCLDAETEVLTRDGWKGIYTIQDDNSVANWTDGSIYFEKPIEIVRRNRRPGERMVVLETPRRSIRVTEDHELLYRTTRGGRFLESKSKDLVGRSIAVPVSGEAVPFVFEMSQP